MGSLLGGLVLNLYEFHGLFKFMAMSSLAFGIIYYPFQVWFIGLLKKSNREPSVQKEEMNNFLINNKIEMERPS